ncbi:hypothetical protein AGABI1DRAFT_82853 [Agaricus bisporus var. burnettii JB137-S8]|uniref:Uncharacterized protein n=1 Tax=Agaricus bisporus var. burnettii (strain JB137-S8 / ATCC MYA-4627 / FGSC 10392) TaxID=597362 RepID=K5XIS3_AGABU|nr:uncharacterized protein AGABI1DRAFT_82853 [Agaricus bisporus var. burnettii JB137-S8]EKM83217.1 hypothetical protein AGABI1DRAFT_82853 [Agaricus bisporus var. burnettii JB137-S8]
MWPLQGIIVHNIRKRWLNNEGVIDILHYRSGLQTFGQFSQFALLQMQLDYRSKGFYFPLLNIDFLLFFPDQTNKTMISLLL